MESFTNCRLPAVIDCVSGCDAPRPALQKYNFKLPAGPAILGYRCARASDCHHLLRRIEALGDVGDNPRVNETETDTPIAPPPARFDTLSLDDKLLRAVADSGYE